MVGHRQFGDKPAWRVPITQMLAHAIQDLQEWSHLGDIINVQFDIHLSRSRDKPTLVALGSREVFNASGASDDG